jgi:hypothetical protein
LINDPQTLLTWDGSQVDDAPQVECSYSALWRDYLVACVGLLKDRTMWVGDTDFNAVEQQINELQRRLMGEIVEDSGMAIGPYFIAPEMLVDSAEPSAIAAQGVSFTNRAVYQTGTPANNVLVYRAKLYLAPGDYVMRVYFNCSSNSGKFSVSVVGDGIYSTGLIDAYAAGPAYNQTQVKAFTVSSGCYHDVDVVVDGKNTSSTGYFVVLSGIFVSCVGL